MSARRHVRRAGHPVQRGPLTDIRQALLAALIASAGIVIHFLHNTVATPSDAGCHNIRHVCGGLGLGIYARSRRAYTDVVEERAALPEREREVRAREPLPTSVRASPESFTMSWDTLST